MLLMSTETPITPTSSNSLSLTYTGVPYALPPVGNRRWKLPVPLPSFNSACEIYERNLKQRKLVDACFQRTYSVKGVEYSFTLNGQKMSEDCLYLNISTPAGDPPREGWPVFFFIHGGWLQVGSPYHTDETSSRHLVEATGGKLIVVEPAYRLNIFGFLASKELQAESPEGKLNFGLWDQRLALEWTFENISKFGGDPHNITIGGLSAGAHSTHWQLLRSFHQSQSQPHSPQLFKRVILFSNAIPGKPKTVADYQGMFEEVCERVGVVSVQELRKVEGKRLVEVMDQMDQHTWRVVIDGSNGFIQENLFNLTFEPPLPGNHENRFAKWIRESDIQIMLTEVCNEYGAFAHVFPSPSLPLLLVTVQNYYPPTLLRPVLPLFPLSSQHHPDYLKLQGRITADLQVYASQRLLVRALKGAGVESWRLWRCRVEWLPDELTDKFDEDLKISHAHDIPIWFSHPLTSLSPTSRSTIDLWLSPFFKFLLGDSEGRGREEWNTKEWEDVRCLRGEGSIEVVKDPLADEMKKLVDKMEELARDDLVEKKAKL